MICRETGGYQSSVLRGHEIRGFLAPTRGMTFLLPSLGLLVAAVVQVELPALVSEMEPGRMVF